ncbi:restriction endonuclease subunit S [Mangrovimicrobium sediminis]|uniref:Restriction endonuclease subunit S n=1 Tax=Mangrovimicrobium sediminis TaxID=2562682 RepID=A0A4Z0LZM3_9GAMM|nr:restriction endonuclease subunit S [Haliea sp. SAOS-164]TGD72636.1 restriction endonuclease subunit S [Haliea sp. SAOS-164]
MSEYESVTLGDCVKLRSGNTPSKARPEFWNGEFPWISAKDMKTYWVSNSEDRLTEVGASNANRVIAGTTLLLTRGMTLHNNIPICRVSREAAFNQDVKAVMPKKGISNEFIPYLLLGNKHKLQGIVDSAGHGTGRLNTDQLLDLSVFRPSMEDQIKIVEVASSLDEKIELNRKQNRTLEAIAQTLFKHWFVDFEFPDENGNHYKSNGGTMQPSEMGEIPVGWKIGKLEQLIAELETGSRPAGGVGQYKDGIPSIGAESITRIGEYDYAKTKYVPEEYFSKMRRGIVKNRDVLIYKDGGTPGRFDARISMFGEDFPYKTACLNEHVFRLQAKKSIYQNYLYLWFSSYPILEELRHRGAKAAIPGINSSDVKGLDFLFVDEAVLTQFDQIVEPLFTKLLLNSREVRTLSNLRDTLLPKLMSGELRVA